MSSPWAFSIVSDEVLILPDACALLDVLRGALGARPQATSVLPFIRLRSSEISGKARFAVPELSVAGFDRNLESVTANVTGTCIAGEARGS